MKIGRKNDVKENSIIREKQWTKKPSLSKNGHRKIQVKDRQSSKSYFNVSS